MKEIEKLVDFFTTGEIISIGQRDFRKLIDDKNKEVKTFVISFGLLDENKKEVEIEFEAIQWQYQYKKLKKGA